MKQKKTALLLAVTATFALSLAGCSNKSNTSSDHVTNYYSVTIDGDMMYYDDSAEDVVNASEIAINFMQACVKKSYQDPDNFNEYVYYRKSVAEELIAAKKQESTKQTLLSNQLSIKPSEQSILNIEFYHLNGLESCMVTLESISEFEHATPEYLDAYGLSLGKKYKRETKVLLVKEDDSWKVDSYTQTAREEV